MSFYHVLASNVSPQTFPNNHASKFSTPLEHPYDMKGKYEVSIMNMTYAGCVNTFHNDEIVVEKTFSLKEILLTGGKPISMNVVGRSISTLIDNINRELSGIVNLKYFEVGNSKFCRWKVLIPDVYIVLSKPLMHRFKLWEDVITPWCLEPVNYHTLKTDEVLTEDPDFHIIIIPPSYSRTTVTLKQRNERITRQEFMRRFNEQLHPYLKVVEPEGFIGTRFCVYKLHDDYIAAIFSPALHRMTRFRQAGLYGIGHARFLEHDFNKTFIPAWNVYLYQLRDTQIFRDKMSLPITIPPHVFQRQSDAVLYLNKLVKNSSISFTLDKNNFLCLNITDDETSVTFTDTLRDIFAFDKKQYSGIGNYRASDVLSLTRRIHFLYVYSNISNYVRVGNTEAPLLAVVPFEPSSSCDTLVEKTFAIPMYVGVARDFISQIDMYIYDGSGELVPFAEQAVTSIRLHYRKV